MLAVAGLSQAYGVEPSQARSLIQQVAFTDYYFVLFSFLLVPYFNRDL